MNQTHSKEINWVRTIFLLFFVLSGLSGCDLLRSSDSKKIEINLSSTTLTENSPITAQLKNHSSNTVLIYFNSIRSPIEKRTNSGVWARLPSQKIEVGQGFFFYDFYSNLKSGETYTTTISYEFIEKYLEASTLQEDIQGAYRMIFDLVFDKDYKNQKEFTSEIFSVE